MASYNDLGVLGEELALEFLEKHHYKILEKKLAVQKG